MKYPKDAIPTQMPQVELNEQQGTLLFKGKFLLEDTENFFCPIVDWIDEYVSATKHPDTEVICDIQALDIPSSVYFLDIFNHLEDLQKRGLRVRVTWYYDQDDEDMYEEGYDLQTLGFIPFKFVPKAA